MKRTISNLLAAILVIGLFAGCSGTKKLTINTDKTTGGSFSLIDTSSNNTLAYDKLMINDREVYETYVHESAIAGWGVVFAFEEGQIVISGGTTSFNGTTTLTGAGEWKYTLNDGVLNIILN